MQLRAERSHQAISPLGGLVGRNAVKKKRGKKLLGPSRRHPVPALVRRILIFTGCKEQPVR